MKTKPNLPLNLPYLDSHDSFDISKSLDLLRYLQGQEVKAIKSKKIKIYLNKLQQHISFLVIS